MFYMFSTKSNRSELYKIAVSASETTRSKTNLLVASKALKADGGHLISTTKRFATSGTSDPWQIHAISIAIGQLISCCKGFTSRF